MIKPAMKTSYGDGALPKADTCFFNLELPDYSSKEIMKEKILLAIHTTWLDNVHNFINKVRHLSEYKYYNKNNKEHEYFACILLHSFNLVRSYLLWTCFDFTLEVMVKDNRWVNVYSNYQEVYYLSYNIIEIHW